jgi:hypothetical protein
VVVHADVAGDCRAIADIDGPGGGPLTAPEVLEIQVVAGHLHFQARAIWGGVDRKFCCALAILGAQVSIHCLSNLITQLDNVGRQVLGLPIYILLFDASLQGHRVKGEL